MLNGPERTRQSQTRNVMGFLHWEFHFQMSCHVPFCSITSCRLMQAHSVVWSKFCLETLHQSTLFGAAHSNLCLHSFSGPFSSPRSSTVRQCNTHNKEEELFIWVPTNSKDLNSILTFGQRCHVALQQKTLAHNSIRILQVSYLV